MHAMEKDILISQKLNGLPDIREFAIDAIMQGIKDDLMALGVKMDKFSSERSLVNSGAVQRAIEKLQQDGHLYQRCAPTAKGQRT